MRRKPIVIDLNDDSMGTLRNPALDAHGRDDPAGRRDRLPRPMGCRDRRGSGHHLGDHSVAFLVLPHYATLCFYLSEVRRGRAPICVELLVGSGIGAVLGGWECAPWTTSRLDISLGLLGAGVGLLAGAFFGMILGVFLGWAERTIRSLLVQSSPPNLDPVNGLGDRWLDVA